MDFELISNILNHIRTLFIFRFIPSSLYPAYINKTQRQSNYFNIKFKFRGKNDNKTLVFLPKKVIGSKFKLKK